MSKARLIITAVVDEKRTKSEVARDYDVSRYWVQQLVRRYLAEGQAAFEPHSRRPHTSPHAVPAGVEDEIVRLRKELSRQGLDAGADTIRTHLARRTPRSQTSSKTAPPSVSTIWRILARRGFLTPQPQKRPRSSWHRFEAEQPNQRWQADTTHWRLADGTPVEILNLLDDHSRLALACVPRRTITGPDVVRAFGDAFVRWGIPASVLTDNGARLPRPPRRGGRVALEIELGRLGVRFDHSRPSHPQTQGKVERFQQTEKKWLAAQPPAKTTAGLQRQLTRFRRYYKQVRPHRALDAGPPGGPTPTDPRPPPPDPTSTRTAGSGTTASTRPAPSPCATTAGCTTSASDASTPAPASPSGRRPPHPGHRPPHRRARPRTHPRPKPRLPAPRSPARPSQEEPLTCNDVPRDPSTVSRDITLVGLTVSWFR